MLSSMSFIVSGLKFRSLIHFKFIFVYDVRECLISFFYVYSCPLFLAPLIEDTFSIVYSCRLCHGLGDHREKAMAPHSSTLTWRIPWREEPGGLQSMGSQRVGHS